METVLTNGVRVETAAPPASDPVLVRVAEVAAAPIKWLWPGRVPSGKLTLVAGDPGLGKSLLALDIAARVTRGLPWPDAEDVERWSVKSGGREPGDSGRICATVGLPDRALPSVPRATGESQDTAGQASRGTPEMEPAGSPPLPSSTLPLPHPPTLSPSHTPTLSRPSAAPANVILLSAEDDVADTIRPRLEAAGADVERVVVLDAVRRRGAAGTAEGPFSLAADLDALERAIDQTGDVALVIIDPLSAYLGRTNSHQNSEVRNLLGLLKKLAHRRAVAVLAVTHLNKNASASALYRATGSLAFVAAARAVWAVARDAAHPGRHLFLPLKCNVAGPTAGLAYTIQDAPGRPGTPILVWEREPVALGAEEALAGASASREVLTERQQAAAWLRELLADGPVPVRRVRLKAQDAGFSWATIKRAKPLARVEPYSTGQRATWEWRLSAQCVSPGSNVSQAGEVSHIGEGETH